MCRRRRSNGLQALLPTEIVGVWEKVAVDLVTIEGHTLLSMIDYGSRFPILRPLRSTTSSGIIDELEDIFALFGLPSTLVLLCVDSQLSVPDAWHISQRSFVHSSIAH